VFTVDLPVFATRYRDVRNGMTGGAGLFGSLAKLWDIVRHTGWLLDVPIGGKPLTFGNLAQAVPSARSLEAMKVWVDAQFDPGRHLARPRLAARELAGQHRHQGRARR
jgi:L-lactate dehydrogenase (cytochrome)